MSALRRRFAHSDDAAHPLLVTPPPDQLQEQFKLEKLVWWWSYQKWVGCIIAMSEAPPESAHCSNPLELKRIKFRVAPQRCDCFSGSLSLQATEGCGGDDQEDRLGALNRWSSQSCCLNRVFGSDRCCVKYALIRCRSCSRRRHDKPDI